MLVRTYTFDTAAFGLLRPSISVHTAHFTVLNEGTMKVGDDPINHKPNRPKVCLHLKHLKREPEGVHTWQIEGCNRNLRPKAAVAKVFCQLGFRSIGLSVDWAVTKNGTELHFLIKKRVKDNVPTPVISTDCHACIPSSQRPSTANSYYNPRFAMPVQCTPSGSRFRCLNEDIQNEC